MRPHQHKQETFKDLRLYAKHRWSVSKRVIEYYLQGMSNRVIVTTPLTEAMESARLPRGGVQVHKEEGPEDRCCPREDVTLH